MSTNSFALFQTGLVLDATATGPSAADTIIAVLLILAVILIMAFLSRRDSDENDNSNEGGKGEQ